MPPAPPCTQWALVGKPGRQRGKAGQVLPGDGNGAPHVSPWLRTIVGAMLSGTVGALGAGLIFFGVIQRVLKEYDRDRDVNLAEHAAIVAEIKRVDTQGTTRGQPAYADIQNLKTTVGEIDRKQAAMQADLLWIRQWLERGNGLRNP